MSEVNGSTAEAVDTVDAAEAVELPEDLQAEIDQVEQLPVEQQGLIKSIIGKLTNLVKGKAAPPKAEDDPDADEDDEDSDDDADEDDSDEDTDDDGVDDEDDEEPLPAKDAKKSMTGDADGDVDPITELSDEEFLNSLGINDDEPDFQDATELVAQNTEVIREATEVIKSLVADKAELQELLAKSIRREGRTAKSLEAVNVKIDALEQSHSDIKKSFGEEVELMKSTRDFIEGRRMQPQGTPTRDVNGGTVLFKSNGITGEGGQNEPPAPEETRGGLTKSMALDGLYDHVAKGNARMQGTNITPQDVTDANNTPLAQWKPAWLEAAAREKNVPLTPES